MSVKEINESRAALEEPKRATLEQLRRTILEVIPDAEQGVAYTVPAFRVRGNVVAGFVAFKNHLSYLPHSGSVFPEMRDELAADTTAPGARRFPFNAFLRAPLVTRLINIRMAQAFPGASH
jgi:uncharacterized protein YdhG (YjbR/CyaY superfamily)